MKLDGNDVFHVSGSHTYAVEGVYTIVIKIQTIGGAFVANDPTKATVSDAPIAYTPPAAAVTKDNQDNTITVNKEFTAKLGTVMDSDPNSNPNDFEASINWGDGSPPDDGTVTPNSTPGQSYTVTGTHTYMQNKDVRRDGYGVLDAGVARRQTNTLLITVGQNGKNEMPIAKNGIVQGKGSFIIAGQTLNNVLAVFTTNDPNAVASDFSATVEWGDDSIAGISPDTSPGIIVQGANDPSTKMPIFFVSGSHIYDRAGTYTFTVTMSVNGGSSASVSDTATVSAAPLISQPAPISGVQGEPLPDNTVVATFTDTAPVPDIGAYLAGTTAMINWGDGDSSEGTITPQGTSPTGTTFVVTGEHTYADENDILLSYQASVAISTADGSGTEVADFVLLTVPVLTDPPVAVKATTGVPFNAPVATIHTTLKERFTANSFTAQIGWGDVAAAPPARSRRWAVGHLRECSAPHEYTKAGSYPDLTLNFADNHGNRVARREHRDRDEPTGGGRGSAHCRSAAEALRGTRGRVLRCQYTLLKAANFTAVINWGRRHHDRGSRDASTTARPTSCSLRAQVQESRASTRRRSRSFSPAWSRRV